MLKFDQIIFLSILSVAIGSGGSALAQSSLKLVVSDGQKQGLFSIDGDVSYSTKDGVVASKILMGKDSKDADNPLFCFQFALNPLLQTVVAL